MAGMDVGVSAGVVVAVKFDRVDVGAIDNVVVGGGVVATADAVGVVAVKAGAVDVGAASVVAGGGATIDVAVAGIDVVDAAAVGVVGAIESGAITAVAVVVVDVLTVTCCDTISDEPREARFAASRAAAGDMSCLLVVAVAVVALTVVVDLMRANPRPSPSGTEPFEPPDAGVVFAFGFTCICSNAALSDCSGFLPFLDLLAFDAVTEVETTRTIIGSCSASSSPSFFSASSSV